MKGVFVPVTVCWIGLVLLPHNVLAQSKEDGIRFFNEGRELANTARTITDVKKAVERYEQALKVFEKVKFDQGIAQSSNNLGNLLKYLGQYSESLQYYNRSVEMSTKTGDLKGKGQALNNLGVVHKDLGQYSKAIEYYEKALEVRRKAQDRGGEGQTIMNLGTVFSLWGQYAKAIDHYQKSLEVGRKAGDVTGQAQSLNNLGIVHSDCGQYAKAIDYYQRSLEMKRKIGDLRGEGSTLGNLGNVYRHWGFWSKASEYYQASLEISRKLGDVKTQGNALNNLGVVHSNLGQFSIALGYYLEAQEIAFKTADAKGQADTLNNMGLLYQQQNQHQEALRQFQRALDISERIGVSIQDTKNFVGHLHLDMGDLKNAEICARESGYLQLRGRVCLVKGDYVGARGYYEQLRQSAEIDRQIDGLFVAYTGLALALEGLGDYKKAAEHYERAIDYTEQVRSSLSADARETFFAVDILGFNRTAPYEGLARVLVKMKEHAEALRISEYGRARVFTEAISRRTAGLLPNVSKDIVERDSQLNEQFAALAKNLQTGYEKQNKEFVTVLEPQVKEAKEKLAAHVDMLRKQYPLFAATKYPQPMSLDQTALKDNEWVLAYHVTDPGLIVYLTKGRNLVKAEFKPVTRKDIDALVRKFREPLEVKSEDTPEQIVHKLKSFDFQTGKKLSDILLADVLPSLPKDARIILVPDDCLGVLPFEMLPFSDVSKIASDGKAWKTSGAEFFGDRNPISYYQSITALTLARTYGKTKQRAEKVLVMDDPVFGPDDSRLKSMAQANKKKLMESLPQNLMSIKTDLKLGFPRLAYTGDLGKSLKSIDPGKTEEHTGMEAAKPVLFKKPLDSYGAMIFATHGYFGKDLPGVMEPVLVLTLVDQPKGQDGFLRLSEVMGLKINADLVALTACQTGLGRKISGEGTMGMGRAFQYAGARCVLVSLWSVSEKASVNLVESFFKQMKAGKSKLEALRLARKEIRDQGYDHPFYWAPFILVGEVN